MEEKLNTCIFSSYRKNRSKLTNFYKLTLNEIFPVIFEKLLDQRAESLRLFKPSNYLDPSTAYNCITTAEQATGHAPSLLT